MHGAILTILILGLAACGSVVSKDDVGDTGQDVDAGDTASDLSDPAGDPDLTGDTEPSDPAGEDVTADPSEDEPTSEPVCGDGTVDPGEDCDDSSDFCVDCALVAPTGWFECTDSLGNPVFYLLEDWTGTHTAGEMRDHCVSLVEGLSPSGYDYYGLAVFHEEILWTCVEPHLVPGTSYYVGLFQDTTAIDYAEPDGGWYWTAYDGSGWIQVDAFDPANTYLPGGFDNGGGGANPECGRIASGMGGWSFMDYSCDTPMDWDGICMITF